MARQSSSDLSTGSLVGFWDGGDQSFYSTSNEGLPRFSNPFIHTAPFLVQAALAARDAGEIIRESYGNALDVVEKHRKDLVSDADVRCQESISRVLHSFSPDARIIGEEAPIPLGFHMGPTWIVDPLDATMAFIKMAGPQYPSVMIAYMEKNILLGSVVHFPLTDEWFYAVKGQGAYKNGEPLSIEGKRFNLKDAWIDINRYNDSTYDSALVSRLEQKLRRDRGCLQVTSSIPHSGIAMRLLEDNSGLAAVVHDNNRVQIKQAIWDISAPKLIVEEAGGCFLSLGSGRVYDVKRPGPIVISASYELAQHLSKMARRTSKTEFG